MHAFRLHNSFEVKLTCNVEIRAIFKPVADVCLLKTSLATLLLLAQHIRSHNSL